MTLSLGGEDVATFTINGTVFQTNAENIQATTTLLEYIRDVVNLKGTKYMCKEGGCGACLVAVQDRKDGKFYSLNSCMSPILKCHGKTITTIEGLGNKKTGYHSIQTHLAAFGGTQCGYCTPGMVMNMYSLFKNKGNGLTMKEIENSFGGNICRCTGYRPILDAFKAMAVDAPNELKLKDIEDLITAQCVTKGKPCRSFNCKQCPTGLQTVSMDNEAYEMDFIETALASMRLEIKFNQGEVKWFKVTTVFEIMQLFDYIGDENYMLVGGNTAQGIYKNTKSKFLYIDVNDVKELQGFRTYSDRIEMGANVTLTEMIVQFERISKIDPLLFGYLEKLAEHVDLVANVPVRNVATLAGNLMIKHEHREFKSDIFLLLETAGAILTIHDVSGLVRTFTLLEFLDLDMYRKAIVTVTLPAISSAHYIVKTFKIMARKQNVPSHVNAGFLFRLSRFKNIVEETPKIVFGGINPKFVHAYETEDFLTRRSLSDPNVIKQAFKILSSELQPDFHPIDATPNYRKKLACSLLYRFILEVNTNVADKRVKSGAYNLERPLSSGKQIVPASDKNFWPVGQRVHKLEALIQCSGEAEYTNDIPRYPNELYAAFVLADRACAQIEAIDASAALKVRGVVSFYAAEDIPGKNSFILKTQFTPEDEEIFCNGITKYAGQPVGLLVATSQTLANWARSLVQIKYGASTVPLLTIDDVLKKGDTSRIVKEATIEPKDKRGHVAHKFKGDLETGAQYHYTIEPQTCLTVPTDSGLKIYSSTQWMQIVQTAVAQSLNIPENSIEIEVKRVGGAYGAKVTRPAMIAAACSLAVHKLGVPVRMVVDMETTMRAIGKRCPILARYEGAVDDFGELQYLNIDMYNDYGFTVNDSVSAFALMGIQSVYDVTTWKFTFYGVKTDNASSVWTRSPGTLEAMTVIETIMEHIAHVTKKDGVSVRMQNLNPDDDKTMKNMVSHIKSTSDYDKRMENVKKENEENRWKKRGLALTPMKFVVEFYPGHYAMVSIFGEDGTVVVSVGGIEIGQGINTKAAQVCAYSLGISLNKINVVSSRNFTSPNTCPTGGTVTSDSVCMAVLKCCEQLNKRLEIVKERMDDPAWEDITKEAAATGVNMTANYAYNLTDALPKNYPVYGVTVIEVELDVLTGQYQILRTDILEDAGNSLSPCIDIGQVEGAFVMGLGYFTSEEIKYDSSGSVLTDRTWNYWPPGIKDIPIDFRVEFVKNSSNPLGVLRSKATGEPPLCMTNSVMFALRQAVRSARKDAGIPDDWFHYSQPCTVEKTCLACKCDPSQFTL